MWWPSKGHFYAYLSSSIFWASLCSSSFPSGVSELSGQLDEVVVGDSPVPGSRERLDQLAFDCRISLDYLQAYFTPEILNRIHILLLGGQGQRPGVVWHFQLLTSLARWHGSLSSFK